MNKDVYRGYCRGFSPVQTILVDDWTASKRKTGDSRKRQSELTHLDGLSEKDWSHYCSKGYIKHH